MTRLQAHQPRLQHSTKLQRLHLVRLSQMICLVDGQQRHRCQAVSSCMFKVPGSCTYEPSVSRGCSFLCLQPHLRTCFSNGQFFQRCALSQLRYVFLRSRTTRSRNDQAEWIQKPLTHDCRSRTLGLEYWRQTKSIDAHR